MFSTSRDKTALVATAIAEKERERERETQTATSIYTATYMHQVAELKEFEL